MKSFSSKLNPIALNEFESLLDKLLVTNESILFIDGPMVGNGGQNARNFLDQSKYKTEVIEIPKSPQANFAILISES